ncbi:MAG: hypothetical protein CHACPFDD_00512 [Phycisphaerae bacterium]|nr:hypothetical protein [Phycisphaerae bacterium]
MVEALKQLLAGQFDAALATLNLCIERCPDEAWNERVGSLKFCQVAFHTLFFADVYLGRSPAELKSQPFHRTHPEIFRDYEEMEDRPQRLLYDRPAIRAYVQHCRAKAADALAAETSASLSGPCGFPRKTFSRAELYIYNIRHIQHHAAQLSLRLRLDCGADIPWLGSGWRQP